MTDYLDIFLIHSSLETASVHLRRRELTMMNKYLSLLIPTLIVITIGFFTSTGVSAQTSPAAPGLLCVQSSTGSSSCASSSSPSASSNSIKWHPGFYAKVSPVANASPNLNIAARAEAITETALGTANKNIKGVMLTYSWAALEPSKGVYNMQLIRDDLNILKAAGKRLIIGVISRSFGTNQNYYERLPAYIVEGSTYGVDYHSSVPAYYARLWQTATMDRYIALFQAIAKEFDGDPYVEAVGMDDETSVGAYGTYSDAKALVEYKRLCAEMASALKQTVFMFNSNWGPGYLSEMKSLMDQMYSSGIAFTSPDIFQYNDGQLVGIGSTGQHTWAQMVYVGEKDKDGLPSNAFDFRTKMAYMPHIEWIDNGGDAGELIERAVSIYKASHIIVADQGVFDSNFTWPKDIRPKIDALSGVTGFSGCPLVYGGRCSSL